MRGDSWWNQKQVNDCSECVGSGLCWALGGITSEYFPLLSGPTLRLLCRMADRQNMPFPPD